MEPQTQQLTPEEAKASLGLSTRLSEQMLMSQVPQDEIDLEGSETSETALEQEQTEEGDMDTKISEMEQRLSEKIDGIKEEIKTDDTDEEIQAIRAELEALLKDDQQETEN